MSLGSQRTLRRGEKGAPPCLWVAEEVGQGLCVEEGLLKRGPIGYFCRPG